ncbi:Na+/H+ antiporter subunit D [Aminobacter sp. AP02]|uniref:Na+/H+ antiporter subunit D n=1 Tax=Aminobacter sp. AP02 TaxID=2135737 RepID=UPI000D6CBED4|nr:Na+/H+ antiporter subunit D [Aminobacter sp. AP02]PWK75769.1 multicomponent Na+:H+ antiporter subunit D [Aminobacter sp. AP02]
MAVQGEIIDKTAAMIAAPVPAADWLVIAPVLLPILAGAVLLMIRHSVRWHAVLSVAVLAVLVGANGLLLRRVLAEGPVSMTMGSWLPPFGISFTVDALGAVFSLTASIVAVCCCVSSVRDVDATGRRYGFYPFLLLMMAGVSGAFLTGDVFNLYVWFEVFLISSFGLLILGSEKSQIDGATKYAILNLVGTTLFLIATGYLYGTFGTLNMADLATKAGQIGDAAPLMTLASLFLLAFAMKAAAFPVNFWLPASYHTPPAITGALFGGLLTKVGIYALLRILVMIFAVEGVALAGVIGWVAVATMLLGALGALAQSDIRRIAGFLVISGVGTMLAGIALGGNGGLSGAIFYALHSMPALSALYLLGGLVRQRGGSFSLHQLSGLYGASPFLTLLAFIISLAVAGLPPGSGLWPKVMLVRAALDSGAWQIAAAILLSGFLATIALGRVFILAFWRTEIAGVQAVAGGSMSIMGCCAVVILTLAMLAMGVMPEPFVRVSGTAASGLLDASSYVRAVFPGGGGS